MICDWWRIEENQKQEKRREGETDKTRKLGTDLGTGQSPFSREKEEGSLVLSSSRERTLECVLSRLSPTTHNEQRTTVLKIPRSGTGTTQSYWHRDTGLCKQTGGFKE